MPGPFRARITLENALCPKQFDHGRAYWSSFQYHQIVMVGFTGCPECGGATFCRHQLGHGGDCEVAAPAAGPSSARSSSGADASARDSARQQLLERAGVIFDAVDALVSYRVSESWNRDKRARITVGDLRRRFAAALVDFARELERVRERRK
jgi:hypothetical protein